MALVSGSSSMHTASRRRFGAVQRVMGLLLMMFSSTMLPPLIVDLMYERTTWFAFLEGLWISLLSGALLWYPVRHHRAELKVRDGFLVVVLFWAVLSGFGAIPFHVTHVGWPTLTEAIFESVSGLTTTGATTIASGLDAMPHAILYYRSQLHWLGGLGIIVLAVAVMPMLGVGGMQLYKAETPGPMKDTKLTPRIAHSARALWGIYLLLSAACMGTYWLLGMSGFDALCHAMATVSTGGFSTHDASIGHFNSVQLEIAVVVFLLAGAMNFSLHYIAWNRRSLRIYWLNAEFRAYLAIYLVLCVITVIALLAYGTYDNLFESLRHGIFQVVAYGTSGGFATADPSAWPTFLPLLLLMLTFIGGCAGGTGGGLKTIRFVLFLKQAGREVRRLIHPNAEVPIKLEHKILPDTVIYAVGGFFSVYIVATVVLSCAFMMIGLDALTALSTTTAALNNVGPGLNEVVSNVAAVNATGKWIMIVAMIAGRLEVFTLLVLFTPSFWRR